MARKNIFQLVEENYDIQSEIRKINNLFSTEYYFILDHWKHHSLKSLIEEYLFDDWKYRGTCISTSEYLERVNATVPDKGVVSENQIINYLEVMENFLKLYTDNGDYLFEKYKIKYYTGLDTVFRKLVNTLKKRIGLTTREFKDRIILYPKNAPLEKVIMLCDDEDVQWELIRYVREDLSLTEKRKSLAYLATNLYVEQDRYEENEHIKELLKSTGNILNTLHIRHNNKTGKWENKALEKLDTKTAASLCDMVYNEILTIVLLREHKEFEHTYEDYNNKQKQFAAKNN